MAEFTTPWCGTSHIIAPILKDLMIQYQEKIKFCRIDIEENRGLAKQYGIEKIPTILLFRKGKVIDFIIGVAARDVLAAKVKLLLIKKEELP